MDDFNPFAAPRAEIGSTSKPFTDGGDLWRDGTSLVMRKGAELPDRCLRCNEPALGYRFKRNLSWHPPGWYLVILLNIILYIIVAMCVRWTAKVAAPICPAHRARRRKAIVMGWVGSLAGIALFVYGLSDPNVAIAIPFGAILFLVSLIVGVVRSQLVVPKRINKDFVWLAKVSPDFLMPLPDWRGEEVAYIQSAKLIPQDF